MSNSSLASMTKVSPNRTSPRTHHIDTITIHCYVGQASIESMAEWLCNPSAQASANYGIGSDGRTICLVPEADRSWCSSNRDNDMRAVTIECASDMTHPYAVNSKVYDALIRLCADICQRNDIKKLVWSNSKDDRVNHRNGVNMTVHRDYANKACPGDYLYNKMGQIAEEVNRMLDNIEVKESTHPLVKIARKLNTQMKEDVANGIVWKYTNGPHNDTFWRARERENYGTNCARFVSWVLREHGALGKNQSFYSYNSKLVFENENSKTDLYKNCEVIDVHGTRLDKLIKDGTAKPGDIFTFQSINHVNMMGYNGKFFDAGHAYCKEQGVNAKFITWRGSNVHALQTVKYIIRLKQTYKYLVIAGSFSEKANAKAFVTELKAKGLNKSAWRKINGKYYVYTGEFKSLKNAKLRAEKTQKAGYDCWIMH